MKCFFFVLELRIRIGWEKGKHRAPQLYGKRKCDTLRQHSIYHSHSIHLSLEYLLTQCPSTSTCLPLLPHPRANRISTPKKTANKLTKARSTILHNRISLHNILSPSLLLLPKQNLTKPDHSLHPFTHRQHKVSKTLFTSADQWDQPQTEPRVYQIGVVLFILLRTFITNQSR